MQKHKDVSGEFSMSNFTNPDAATLFRFVVHSHPCTYAVSVYGIDAGHAINRLRSMLMDPLMRFTLVNDPRDDTGGSIAA